MTDFRPVSYASYTETGNRWLGVIPSHWQQKRVKDELKSLDFRRIPLSAEERGKMTNPRYDYYGASGVIDKVDGYLFDETTILIGEDGANLLMRGSALAFLAKGKYWVNNHAHILKPKRGSIDYLCYLLESFDYTECISGSAQPKFTAGELQRVPLMIPPLPEQKAIAEYLDRKTDAIDRRVELLEKKAQLYRDIKQSLINETVTRGLDESAPLRDSGVDWIGQIPEHWKTQRIVDAAQQRKVPNRGLRNKNLLSLSYGRIIRRDFETSHGLIPASFETYQIVRPGNIILRLTDLQNDMKSLRVGIVSEPGIITSAYMCLEFHPKHVPDYFYYLLYAFDISKVFYWQGGGLRQSMKFDDIKVLPIVFPPEEEQRAIVTYLNEKTTKIDGIVEAIETQIAKLKELRKTLINDVVTGKIRVTKPAAA